MNEDLHANPLRVRLPDMDLDSGHRCDTCGAPLRVVDWEEVLAPDAEWRYVPHVVSKAVCGTKGCAPWLLADPL